MKERTCLLVGLVFGLVLFLCAVSAGTSGFAPAQASTVQHEAVAISSDRGPPEPSSEPSSCPLSATTSPVWWDTPPQSGSVVMLPSGEEIIVPGRDDEVRVIILLGGEPVSKYKSRLPAATVRPAQAEQGRIRSYADELRASHRRLLAEIEAQGITLEVRREYSYLLNGLAVSTKMGDIKRIEALPGVRGVYPDYEVCVSLEDSVPLIGADQVWTMLDPGGQPVTGEGIRVAIIDSGIDYNHPDLGGGFGPGYKVLDGYDFYNDDDDPMDDHYHGTHCAGIVSADGAVKGVAPGATLYAYKVFCSTG